MSSIPYDNCITRIQLRAYIIMGSGNFCKGSGHIKESGPAGDRLKFWNYCAQIFNQSAIEFPFQRQDTLISMSYQRLFFFEFREDIALSGCCCLTTLIMGGDQVKIWFCDIDIIAKNPVIPDLERFNARLFALFLLETLKSSPFLSAGHL